MYESNFTLSSNMTLNGTTNETIPGVMQLCYIEDSEDNYQAFLDQCRNNNTNNDTIWLLASNSNTDQDQNVDVLHSIAHFNDSHVQGFIMISDLMIQPANDSELNGFSTP
jgi:hypothetical protein